MKKTFLTLAMVFCLSVSAHAASIYTGAIITGSCGSTGKVASATDMDSMYTSILDLHTDWANKVVQAIIAGTKAEEAASAQNTKGELQAQAAQERNRINAEAKIASANRNIFDLPTDPCPNNNMGYFFIMSDLLRDDAIGRSVAVQRDFSSGITEDMNKRDLALGKIAKLFDKHGFLFAGPVYTPKQYQSAGDAFDLLLPDWKNPRPKNMKSGGVEEARYLTTEARVRILRSVLADTWFNFTTERAPVIPAEDIYKYIGPNASKFTMTDYSSIVDPKTGLVQNRQPAKIEIDLKGDVSRRVLFEAPFHHYTNDEILKDIGSAGAAAVLKEDLKLHGFEYYVLNEIRKELQMNNLLKSLSLLQYYGSLVELSENQIAK